eukprot:1010137-Prorocentrum_lima.AAC.1
MGIEEQRDVVGGIIRFWAGSVTGGVGETKAVFALAMPAWRTSHTALTGTHDTARARGHTVGGAANENRSFYFLGGKPGVGS